MKFCPKCGRHYANKTFCAHDGTKLVECNIIQCSGQHEIKSPLGNKIPSLKEAIDWCIEQDAIVKFIFVIGGGKRVEVRVGGYNPVERDTIEECIADIDRYKRTRRP